MLLLIATSLSNVVELPLANVTPKDSNWIEEDIIPEGLLFTSLYCILAFSQIPALYFRYWPVEGVEILTSVISPKLLIVEVPPPEEPAVFLNKPPLTILASDVLLRSVALACATI